MPTINPRITITLEPSLHAVLKRLSQLTDKSQSAIISELLDTSMPIFERVIAALEAASEIQQTASTEIAAGLQRAQKKVEAQLGLMLGELDDTSRPILQEAEKVQRRGHRAAAATGSTPVPVTRGSGPRRSASAGHGKGVKGGRV